MLAGITIVAPTFASNFPTKILFHFRKLNGEQPQICSISDDPDFQATSLESIVRRNRPQALVAISVRPSLDMVARYRALAIPMILIDEEASGAATIMTDNAEGGALAGEYLAKKGRERIAVVSGPTAVAGGLNAAQRLAGCQHATIGTKARITHRIEVLHYSMEDGIEAPISLFTGPGRPDAIFCAAGDVCASGLLKAAKILRLKIPQDLAIVGYDDDDLAQILTPPLTTIRQPLKEMAEAAFRMASEPAQTLAKPQKVVFKPKLIVRESA